MAWTLDIYDETGTVLEDTRTDEDAVPAINGGFRVVVRNTGDCVSLTFSGRNDLLQIRPRQVVSLTYESTPLFWGVITKAPNLASPGAGFDDSSIAADLEEFVAEGGRSLITDRSSGARYIDQSTDVAEIFEEFLTLYGPPQLTGDVSQINTTGAVLTLFYKPNDQLDVVLDELVSTLEGWAWGVDAQGRVFLRQLSGLLEFNATELVDFYFKPVSSEDIVTKVNLVVSGSPSGRVPDEEVYFLSDRTLHNSAGGGAADARVAIDYVPMPIVYSYEHPLHSVYGAERTFALPPGIVPFLEGPQAAAISGMTLTDVSNTWSGDAAVYDGNSATFATTTAATWGSLRWSFLASGSDPVTTQRVVGFRLIYSAQIAGTAYTAADIRGRPHVRFYQNVIAPGTPGTPSPTFSPSADNACVAERYFLLRTTYDTSTNVMNKGAMYSVSPVPATFAQINLPSGWTAQSCYTQIDLAATNVTSGARIFQYYPLVLNNALLHEVALANIKLPSSLSGDVVVLGYSAPTPVVRVTNLFGTPVGDPPSSEMYEAVETVEYIMSPQDGFMTRYSVGNDSASDAATLLKRYVRDGITAANYAFTMGYSVSV